MNQGYSTVLFQIDTTQSASKQTQIREFFVTAILNRSLMPGMPCPQPVFCQNNWMFPATL